MSTELSKELLAICMMGGVIIWVEKDRADKLEALFKLPRGEWPQFVEVGGQMVNPSRVEGIFSAAAMEDAARRKNGEWQCRQGNWHERFEKCECKDAESTKSLCERALQHYKQHGHWPLWAPSPSVRRQHLGV